MALYYAVALPHLMFGEGIGQTNQILTPRISIFYFREI
jgi:hypothetical protein